MCRVLQVSRSGFYVWKNRPESKGSIERRRLLGIIEEIFTENKQRFGSPRVYRAMKKLRETVSENTVASYMRENDWYSKTKRKFKHTTDSNHDLPIADNLLERDFTPDAPDQSYVGDITYVRTREGWLYLATVIDLYSRKIVGWAMSHRIDRHLVIAAMRMAITNRRPAKGLIFHSDRGSQYASGDFRKLLEKHGVKQSMSRRGDCWDNAVAESFFFATINRELIHHEDYETREEARMSIFEYIEVYYNRKRLHSTIGYLSPMEYEELKLWETVDGDLPAVDTQCVAA
jgi:putative transposase